MKKNVLFILLIISIFPIIVFADTCDGSSYACMYCTYHLEKYDEDFTYTVKSDGQLISVSRDKSEWTTSPKDWTHVSENYYIKSDNIVGENFITTDNKGNKKLSCLDNIYFYLTPMSNNFTISNDNSNNSAEAAYIIEEYNNEKNVYSNDSNSNVKSCTYKAYKKTSMGYSTLGSVTIVSDGKSILSQTFSDSTLLSDNSKDYSDIAKLFDVNNKNSDCPDLYVVCYQNICTISTEGIEGWNTSGEETKDSDKLSSDNSETPIYTPTIIPQSCESLLGSPTKKDTPAYYLTLVFKYVRYGAVILLIVLSVMDFLEATASHDDDELNKVINKTITRIILCVILFLLPNLIEFVLEIINDKAIDICINS